MTRGLDADLRRRGDGQARSARDWRLIVLVAAAVLVAGLPSLWTRGLWSGEEVRLVEVARESVVLREPLVQRLNGRPCAQGPPLPFWLTGILWAAGAGHDAGRLLSVLAVLATALAVGGIVSRFAGTRAALVAALAMLSSLGVFWQVRVGDGVAVAMLVTTLALGFGYEAAHRSSAGGSRSAWLFACAGAGLCVLAGGALSLGVVVLALGLWWWLGGRRGPAPGVWWGLAGAAVAGVTVLAWAAPAALSLGSARAVAPALTGGLRPPAEWLGAWGGFRRLLRAALFFLPWLPVLVVAAVGALRRRGEPGSDLALLAACWLVAGGALVVLVADSLRGGLALLAPAAGILCGFCVGPVGDRKEPAGDGGPCSGPLVWALVIGALMVGLILLIGTLHLLDFTYLLMGKHHVCPVTDEPYSPRMLAAVMPFLALAQGVVLVALLGRSMAPWRRAAVFAAGMILAGLAMDIFLTPYMDGFMSAESFGREVARRADERVTLYQYGSDFDGRYNRRPCGQPCPAGNGGPGPSWRRRSGAG